jgi:hypothetical protein
MITKHGKTEGDRETERGRKQITKYVGPKLCLSKETTRRTKI